MAGALQVKQDCGERNGVELLTRDSEGAIDSGTGQPMLIHHAPLPSSASVLQEPQQQRRIADVCV